MLFCEQELLFQNLQIFGKSFPLFNTILPLLEVTCGTSNILLKLQILLEEIWYKVKGQMTHEKLVIFVLLIIIGNLPAKVAATINL